MGALHVVSYHGGRGVRGFSWKRLCLCGQLVTRKGLKQALCRIWRYLTFNIFNIGFRLWIYECIKLCLQWNTIPMPAIRYNKKTLKGGQLLWPAACIFKISKVSDDACQWNGHDVVISIGGFLFYRTLCMLHDTRRKAEHSVTLLQRFPPLCARLLFVVNTLTVFLSFCYIECQLFAVFVKILFDNWRRFYRPSVVYAPVKCPRGGGIWTAFWPGSEGIWTIIFKKKSNARGVARGGCCSFDLTDKLSWEISSKIRFFGNRIR